MTLDDMKLYLKVDADEEEDIISSLMTAAESFIQRSAGKTKVATGVDELGVTTYAAISTDELYNLCVKLMVAHWYENRAVQATTQLNDFSFSVQALMNHIAMCGDYA